MNMFALGIIFGLICGIHAQCGQSNFHPVPHSIDSYIVGGTVATKGDFPWQMGLLDGNYLICGGSMVLGSDGKVKVITAAHCVTKNNNPYSVVFGMHNTGVSENRYIRKVARVIRHSGYNSNTFSNDIAILDLGEIYLTSNETASTHAKFVCLPSRTYTDGEYSLVSGWGTTSESGSSSSLLQYVWKPVIDRTYCNSRTGNAGYIDSTMLCAGETSKDACQGDSGGPLVAHRDGKWELIGIVSWGFGCGRENYPGVYADTWALRSWISANL